MKKIKNLNFELLKKIYINDKNKIIQHILLLIYFIFSLSILLTLNDYFFGLKSNLLLIDELFVNKQDALNYYAKNIYDINAQLITRSILLLFIIYYCFFKVWKLRFIFFNNSFNNTKERYFIITYFLFVLINYFFYFLIIKLNNFWLFNFLLSSEILLLVIINLMKFIFVDSLKQKFNFNFNRKKFFIILSFAFKILFLLFANVIFMILIFKNQENSWIVTDGKIYNWFENLILNITTIKNFFIFFFLILFILFLIMGMFIDKIFYFKDFIYNVKEYKNIKILSFTFLIALFIWFIYIVFNNNFSMYSIFGLKNDKYFVFFIVLLFQFLILFLFLIFKKIKKIKIKNNLNLLFLINSFNFTIVALSFLLTDNLQEKMLIIFIVGLNLLFINSLFFIQNKKANSGMLLFLNFLIIIWIIFLIFNGYYYVLKSLGNNNLNIETSKMSFIDMNLIWMLIIKSCLILFFNIKEIIKNWIYIKFKKQ